MQQVSHHDLDQRLSYALDRAGVIGGELRGSLLHDLKAKVVLRGGRDAVEVVGPTGSGKRTIASAVHLAARDVLGRGDARVDFDCGAWTNIADGLMDELQAAAQKATGGTLVLDRFDSLGESERQTVRRTLRRDAPDTLLLSVRGEETPDEGTRAGSTAIRIKPLHEREEDIWELVDHFFQAVSAETDIGGCRGFSRQAKADLAASIRETGLTSVRRLRDLVRDLVFEGLAQGPLPLKITSEMVRPHLEAILGQTRSDREERDAALIESQFESMVNRSLLDRLSELHGVPAELLERQAAVINDVIGYVDDVPRSYRNIMDRSDDIMRASLWLLSGATTQAEFRRFFGDERFMRPTKSVAWAFFNRVFKRDV